MRAGDLSILRDPDNGLVTGTSINAVSTSTVYNSFGEPAGYAASTGAGVAFSQDYVRDKLGRIVEKTETVLGAADVYGYTYDLAGRLADVVKNGLPWAHYDFDTNGNRLFRTDSAFNITAGIYDGQDRLLQYGDNAYSYTANGELARKENVVTHEISTYDYDVLGNLRHVVLPTGHTIDYVIDGQNRRIGKRVNGVLVQAWLYSGQLTPAAELDGLGNVMSRFVGTSYFVKNGNTYRIVGDHLGSPRLVVDVTTGAIVQRMDYDEFGNVALDTNPGFQPFGFAGGLYDRDTKLVRFGARDYDPETGRWTSKDPILFEGGDTNLYVYVVGDPVNGFDPSGKYNNWLVNGTIESELSSKLKEKVPDLPENEREKLSEELRKEMTEDEFSKLQDAKTDSDKVGILSNIADRVEKKTADQIVKDAIKKVRDKLAKDKDKDKDKKPQMCPK